MATYYTYVYNLMKFDFFKKNVLLMLLLFKLAKIGHKKKHQYNHLIFKTIFV
jgi:hypothetical protein